MTDYRRRSADERPRERPRKRTVDERPPAPRIEPTPYFALAQRLPSGRPYGAKVIITLDANLPELKMRLAPGLIGRIAQEDAPEWVAIQDDEVLVDFGSRGRLPVKRAHLRLDQI